jgi:hypothetical protein
MGATTKVHAGEPPAWGEGHWATGHRSLVALGEARRLSFARRSHRVGRAPRGQGRAGGGQQARCARSRLAEQDTVVASSGEFFIGNFHVATVLFICFFLRFQMLQRMRRATIDFVESFPFS